MGTIGRTCVFSSRINKHGLFNKYNQIMRGSILDGTTTLMLHHRFVDVTKVSVCKSIRQNLENMKNEPNNTHIL